MSPIKSIVIGATLTLAATSGSILLAKGGNGNVGTLTCNGGPMEVSGNGNYMRISGTCSVLTVKGAGNVVVVDRAQRIIVSGTGHYVQYIQLNPSLKKQGSKVHPVQSVTGTGSVVSWTKGVEPKSPV
jgi:hypothetical protein